MQRGRRGLVPLKTVNVVDEEGSTYSTPKQQEWYRRHLAKVLNIMGEFDEDELERLRSG